MLGVRGGLVGVVELVQQCVEFVLCVGDGVGAGGQLVQGLQPSVGVCYPVRQEGCGQC